MAGFWRSLFEVKTPAERLHEKIMRTLEKTPDLVMIPKAREAIDEGKFVSINLHEDGEDSSMIMLDKGERCLFFDVGLEVMTRRELDGFATSGESYDAILNWRNRRLERATTQAIYRTNFIVESGVLAVTDRRVLFVPQSDNMRESGAIEMKLDEILSMKITDDMLVTIILKGKKYQIYTKYAECFKKVVLTARKCDKIVETEDMKTIEIRGVGDLEEF